MEIYALLKLFGERYIFADSKQAQLDLDCNREDLIAAYSAILELAKHAGDKSY